MKKLLFLILLMLCSNISIWSQDEDYASKVDLEAVKLSTAKKTSKLLTQYNFPKDYEKTLESHISDFEYNKEITKNKYSEAESQRKLYSLIATFETWRESEISMIEKANILWGKTAAKHNLDEEYKTIYLNYHFYLYRLQKDDSPLIKERIEKLIRNKGLINLAKTIAKKETKRVISKCSAVQELGSFSIEYANEKLFTHLKTLTSATLSSKSELTLKRDSDLYCSYAFKKVLKKKKERDSLRKIKENKKFISRAKEIGLDSKTATTILSLIKIRKNDLESLKNKKKEADEMSELFENTDLKTKTEIKREFARNLAKTVNRKQFSHLFGNVFMKNVEKKSTIKIEDLRKTYELNDSQIEKITKMIKTFYFNQETITAYYAYDKKLKKQKLSASSFKYEKEYKELMKNFNLEVKPGVKVNNRTYLWNN